MTFKHRYKINSRHFDKPFRRLWVEILQRHRILDGVTRRATWEEEILVPDGIQRRRHRIRTKRRTREKSANNRERRVYIDWFVQSQRKNASFATLDFERNPTTSPYYQTSSRSRINENQEILSDCDIRCSQALKLWSMTFPSS